MMPTAKREAALCGLLFTLPLGALIVTTSVTDHFRALSIGYFAALLLAVFSVTYRLFLYFSRQAPADRPAHLNILLSSGCILAAATTAPLFFGWATLRTPGSDFTSYRLEVFSHGVFSFHIRSYLGIALLHAPLVAWIILIAGSVRGIFVWFGGRGVEAKSNRPIESLVLLLTIGSVGVATIFAYTWLGGQAYWLLALVEEILVMVGLVWLALGNLFQAFLLPPASRTAATVNVTAPGTPRRRFAYMLFALGFGMACTELLAVWRHSKHRRRSEVAIKPIANIDSLPVGGSKVFTFLSPATNCLLVRTSETNFVAYNQSCTHLSCSVIPEVELGRLACPCHKGYFDLLSGTAIAGPPRRPLQRITLEVHGQLVYASGVEQTIQN